MLSEAQERYLQTIPESLIAQIEPWNPKTQVIASDLMREIKIASPKLDILYTGASALGISGINDLDFTIPCPKENWSKYLPDLVKVLGSPDKIGEENIRWENIKRDGFVVNIHMTDPKNPTLQEHIKLFELLKDNRALLEEYESLKVRSNGIPFREYQRRKYEFYNRALGLENPLT